DTRDSDRVPIAGSAHQRRYVSSVVLGGPEAVARNLQGSEAYPLAFGFAAVVEVQTRMIHKDGQTAANEHGDKKEVEEMAVAHPDREAVRPGEIVRVYLRNRRDPRQSAQRDFHPRGRDGREDRDADAH